MGMKKWQTKAATLVGLFSFLFVLGACAAVYGLREEPQVSLADIRIRDIKAMEGIFLIKLRVLNPNDVPLTLYGVHCTLEVNGRHFANGITTSDQIVPAYGTTVVPVTVYASVLDIVSSAMGLMHTADGGKAAKQAMPYTLQGTVVAGVQSFRKEIPFQSSGELSLQGLTPQR